MGEMSWKLNKERLFWLIFLFQTWQEQSFRPALVISNNRYNQTNLDTGVLAITSNLSPHSYKILIEMQDLENSSLPVKSAIRVDNPFQSCKLKY